MQNFNFYEQKSKESFPLLIMPVFKGEDWWGIITFCNTNIQNSLFDKTNILQLSAMINMLGTYLEKKEISTLLKEKINSLQTIIDTITIPIYYKDKEGRYLGCNKPFELFVKLERKYIIGKTVFDIWKPAPAKIYHQKDTELINNPGTQIYEGPIIDPQSNSYDVIFNKATLTNQANEVIGLVGVFWNITEYKKIYTDMEIDNKQLTTENKFGQEFISAIYRLIR